MPQTKTIFNQAVAQAVAGGFSSQKKTLPSWLFYDHEGDGIFQQIMRMPEYYPTRCEYDILQEYKANILRFFARGSTPFRLIEFGAGDGLKTEVLLQYFVQQQANFSYLPVDVSANALELLTQRLRRSLPSLRVEAQNKRYDEALSSLRDTTEKKVILFMGANIGNFTTEESLQFLKRLAVSLRKNDMLLVGFDLKKDPRVILEAYDDPRGLTAAFNLNLLRRLNREAGANFQPKNFAHYPLYDPDTGTTKSFLISMTDQDVYVEALQASYHFNAWEPVQTEVSQKYDIAMIKKLMSLAGFNIEEMFFDTDKYFCDVLVTPS